MFGQIIEILNLSPIVEGYTVRQLVEEDAASFLRIEVALVDGSQLFIKELLFPDGSKYSYQWQSSDEELLIRWDNAPHHHHEIATHPDHKHVGAEVLPSNRISIEDVLSTITAQVEADKSNRKT